MNKTHEQTWDAVEEYFECVTECDLDDKECVQECVLVLKEDDSWCVIISITTITFMTNENALWQDMSRLNAMYEELMWPVDDELTMRIEGDHIVIRNFSQEQRNNLS